MKNAFYIMCACCTTPLPAHLDEPVSHTARTCAECARNQTRAMLLAELPYSTHAGTGVNIGRVLAQAIAGAL